MSGVLVLAAVGVFGGGSLSLLQQRAKARARQTAKELNRLKNIFKK
jgi:hypothetical protein